MYIVHSTLAYQRTHMLHLSIYFKIKTHNNTYEDKQQAIILTILYGELHCSLVLVLKLLYLTHKQELIDSGYQPMIAEHWLFTLPTVLSSSSSSVEEHFWVGPITWPQLACVCSTEAEGWWPVSRPAVSLIGCPATTTTHTTTQYINPWRIFKLSWLSGVHLSRWRSW